MKCVGFLVPGLPPFWPRSFIYWLHLRQDAYSCSGLTCLFKMSYSPEEDLGEAGPKQPLTPRRQMGSPPGPTLGLSTLCLQTKQQLSKCSTSGIPKPLRIIPMAGVLLPPPQCPSRPVLEGLGKQQFQCTPVAGRLPAPGILPRVPLSSSFHT